MSVRKRLESNLELAQRIRAAQEAAGWTLGSRRVAEALKHDGYPRKPGHNQVAEVMRSAGLGPRKPKEKA